MSSGSRRCSWRHIRTSPGRTPRCSQFVELLRGGLANLAALTVVQCEMLTSQQTTADICTVARQRAGIELVQPSSCLIKCHRHGHNFVKGMLTAREPFQLNWQVNAAANRIFAELH